jgi:oligoendopeptidase F
VQIEFSCNHRANELTKFIKKSEKFTNVLLILFYLYIKFQDQNHRNERAVKKRKFLTNLISQICQKFLFLV